MYFHCGVQSVLFYHYSGEFMLDNAVSVMLQMYLCEVFCGICDDNITQDPAMRCDRIAGSCVILLTRLYA